MDCTKLLIFLCLGFGLTTCSDTYFREYYYFTQKLTWSEAQNYCREKYTDLATIESPEDFSRLNRPSVDTWSWIGLTDDPKSWKGVMGNDSNSWRWSATGKTSETGYQNWGRWEPNNNGGRQTCVFMNREGRWVDSGCSTKIPFVCYNDTNPPGQKTYSVITNRITWTEAQKYCRTHHTDLATIENVQENNDAMSKYSAWIGLYRVPWRWSDKSSSSFMNWGIREPNNYRGTEYCVVMKTENVFADLHCNRKISFWCYDLGVKQTMVRMKIQTCADLSDPATNAQILQQLSERFKTLQSDVALRWVTQPENKRKTKLMKPVDNGMDNIFPQAT